MKPKIKAFKELNDSGKRISLKNKILEFIIKRNGVTMHQIESLLGIKHETASARMSELEDQGLIYVSSTYNEGKRSVWIFEPNIQKQEDNRLGRLKMKYDAWHKRGRLNNWI